MKTGDFITTWKGFRRFTYLVKERRLNGGWFIEDDEGTEYTAADHPGWEQATKEEIANWMAKRLNR